MSENKRIFPAHYYDRCEKCGELKGSGKQTNIFTGQKSDIPGGCWNCWTNEKQEAARKPKFPIDTK